jgi:hypothetical protein
MTTYSDDFNRADSSDLGSDWTQPGTSFAISGNKMARVAGGSDHVQYAHDLSSSDHFVQATVTDNANTYMVINLRNSGGLAQNGYYCFHTPSFGDQKWNINKWVGGSGEAIGSSASGDSSYPSSFVLRAEVEGDEIRVYADGVLKLAVTDPSPISTGLRVGFNCNFTTSAATYDNFSAGDLVSAAVPAAIVLAVTLPAATATGQAPATMFRGPIRSTAVLD